MTGIRAHFDGKVFVPDEPVDVPVGTAASVHVPLAAESPKSLMGNRKPLAELAALLDAMPHESDLPPDASMNIDHYLYGHPKRAE